MKTQGLLFMMALIVCSCVEETSLTNENIYQYELTYIDSSDFPKVRADVILASLPLNFDSAEMINEVKAIMQEHNLVHVYIFRDQGLSLLLRLSTTSAYREQELRRGYLGTIKN